VLRQECIRRSNLCSRGNLSILQQHISVIVHQNCDFQFVCFSQIHFTRCLVPPSELISISILALIWLYAESGHSLVMPPQRLLHHNLRAEANFISIE